MDNSINHIVKKLRESRILAERTDYSQYSRNDLIKLAQSGDALALELLIQQHTSLINMIARKYFLNYGDHDDLYQVGSEGFWQAVMDWKGTGDFEAFAGMYIKRYIAKELDKESANKVQINVGADSIDATIDSDGEGERTLGDVIPAKGVSLDDEVAGREGVRNLSKFLKSNFNQKELEVIEKYIEGYKVKEIAEVLDMPYKSAENILYKIKYKLKEYLKDQDVHESTSVLQDLEFSEAEKKLLKRAISSIKESRALKESPNYEDYSAEQFDDILNKIDYKLEDLHYSGVYEDDLDDLDAMESQIADIEPFLTDAQYEYSEELLKAIWSAKDDCQYYEDPHAEEKIRY